MIEDLWYKNAVIYCLDVETFMDGNGDGIGDFIGLTRRLDYLAGLGITCLWLQPFYRSPNRDNGYDIADYYAVDPRLGDLGDFVGFTHQAKQRGMRVIIDLVVNHTSNEHPWFTTARTDPQSKFRDFYLWSKDKPSDAHRGMVFPGEQKSTWTWDEAAGAWYYHRFFDFQPDLNISNPAVRSEILKIMGFWLEVGVSGFRVDAVPFLIERRGHSETKGHAYEFLNDMRQFLTWRRGDAILLAEANVEWEQASELFGDGTRMQMVFNFAVNQAFYVALVKEDVRPLAKAIGTDIGLHDTAQWAQFLRNHDELDLGRLSTADRKRVFEALGPDERMQIYDRGLRRRLAPMLNGDRAKLELVHSLLMALPGTPVLWYGDEIGMGEDLELDQRTAVRTPMQWSTEPNAGFSTTEQIVRPIVRGKFGPERVNVADQRRKQGSLLNFIERLIRTRKDAPEVGWGQVRVLKSGDPAILALRYDWNDRTVITLHNFAAKVRTATLSKADAPARLANIITSDHSEPTKKGGHSIELPAHGFRWYRMGHDDAPGV